MTVTALPLKNLRIAVTRPKAQAIPLMESINRLGGNALSFPLLEIKPLTDQTTLHQQIAHLAQANYAVFVSPNAAHFAMQAISTLPSHIRTAVVGMGSANALAAHGVSNIIVPATGADSEALLALPEFQHMAGKHVIIFRGETGRPLLGATLQARGATVEFVTCYHCTKPILDVASLINQSPDAITLTSSDALRHLNTSLNAQQFSQLCQTPLFTLHERISQAAADAGWQQVITTEPGDDGMLASLVAWATS